MRPLVFILLFFSTFSAQTQDNQASDLAPTHSLIRKVAVFPLDTAKKDTAQADLAWWKIREELTNNKRFLVAGKQLMVRKEVMQPRSTLEPADVILLGKLLDAHALVTTYLKNRTLQMTVYGCENGMVLWDKKLELSTATPLGNQFESVSSKLIRDFMASIPYQGFQILDPLIGSPTFEESKAIFAKVDAGQNNRIQVGELVQWVQVKSIPPVFQNLSNTTIIAEGHVVENRQGILTVEIKRLKEKNLLIENALVRIPSEDLRLKENWSLSSGGPNLSADIITAEMRSTERESDSKKSLTMTGTTISSMLLLLLLAF
jgi:hypothetical protein